LATLISKLVRVEGVMITVVDVVVASDLKHADVFVSMLGGAPSDHEFAFSKLKRLRSEIQTIIGKRVPMKFTPRLHFKLDSTAEHATTLVQLLDDVEEEDRKRRIREAEEAQE